GQHEQRRRHSVHPGVPRRHRLPGLEGGPARPAPDERRDGGVAGAHPQRAGDAVHRPPRGDRGGPRGL
ncbi:MAG: hypothetical protein AVDCRST_MAG59-2073, partial [uncultured Thermomicrobiales bacterium]